MGHAKLGKGRFLQPLFAWDPHSAHRNGFHPGARLWRARPASAQASAGLADHLHAGMAMQRLWLTATCLGLGLQPEMSPLIFRRYVQAGRPISAKTAINSGAVDLARRFERLSSSQPGDDFAFFCRISHSQAPRSRSLRKESAELMLDGMRHDAGYTSKNL